MSFFWSFLYFVIVWRGGEVADGCKKVFRIRIHFLRIRIRIRIRIQSGSRALMTKNWKKITAEKKVYLSLSLHKVCPSYRRSLQLTKEAIQHFKTWIFSTFVGHFCPPGSGSTGPIEYGSNTDPDPDPKPSVKCKGNWTYLLLWKTI